MPEASLEAVNSLPDITTWAPRSQEPHSLLRQASGGRIHTDSINHYYCVEITPPSFFLPHLFCVLKEEFDIANQILVCFDNWIFSSLSMGSIFCFPIVTSSLFLCLTNGNYFLEDFQLLAVHFFPCLYWTPTLTFPSYPR